jgi:hypothetical protein
LRLNTVLFSENFLTKQFQIHKKNESHLEKSKSFGFLYVDFGRRKRTKCPKNWTPQRWKPIKHDARNTFGGHRTCEV